MNRYRIKGGESMKHNVCVTVRTSFEAFYIDLNDTGLNCHDYKLEVTVDGRQRYIDNGEVIKFEDLRGLVNRVVPDKCYLTPSDIDTNESQLISLELTLANYLKVCTVKCKKITAETLLSAIVSKIQSILNVEYPGVTVQNAKLRENSNSFVSWESE